jgi:CRP/FNR family transcriptional regulator, nitrogen fixation regulation protein
MYREFGARTGSVGQASDHFAAAKCGYLEARVLLKQIGTRLSFSRNDEIYAEGDDADYWYKVVSGTVRVCKLLADGRRHIAEFCFAGESFGLDGASERQYAAEAVDHAIVMRLRRNRTEELLDQNPMVARLMRDDMLRDLTNAHGRTLLLGRMTAPERVAAFLLEMFERRERTKSVDLPMSRIDIADYLGLTMRPSAAPYQGSGATARFPSPIRIASRCSIELLSRRSARRNKRLPRLCFRSVLGTAKSSCYGHFSPEVSMSGSRLPDDTEKPICIVDDDEPVAESLRALLQAFGFTAQSFSCGREFWLIGGIAWQLPRDRCAYARSWWSRRHRQFAKGGSKDPDDTGFRTTRCQHQGARGSIGHL